MGLLIGLISVLLCLREYEGLSRERKMENGWRTGHLNIHNIYHLSLLLHECGHGVSKQFQD